MSQKHNEYKRCQLPENLFSIEAKNNCHAIEVSDRNRHCYYGHHGRFFLFQFIVSAFDEWPSPVEIDECGQRCHNINISGKLPIHTYEALNHWRQKDNWNGEYQNDEKFIAKICHHMRMVIMPAMKI